jgi:hypothetical protein
MHHSNKVVSESGSVDQERTVIAKKKKKKKEMSEKYEEKKRNPKKEETLEQALQIKASSKIKMYSILKNFEVEDVAVEVEEMVTVVKTVVKKGIMRRMGNQTNKIRR